MKAQISQLQSRAITALKPAIDWYQSRQAREQKVLQLLALVVALLMLVSLVWMPAWETRAQQRNSWQAQEKLRAWIAANEPVIRQLQASTGGNRMAGDWMSGLSRSAAAASVTVKSINQEADQSVRVQLENQSFDATFLWLQSLAGQGIQVASAEVLPGAGSGRINLRATLKQGL